MKRMIWALVVGAVVGLAGGYYFFGEIAGVRLSISQLLPGSAAGIGGALRNAAQQVAGVDMIRRNILLSGGGGALLGAVGALTTGKRRR